MLSAARHERRSPKNIPWKGGDNAEVGAYWNKAFEKTGCPPGYRPIQHGEGRRRGHN